jgi:uncharacterized membrane protein YkvA (DUF1232 family)
MQKTTKVGSYARRFAEWTARLPEDVELTWAVLNDERVGHAGRRILAGALSYFLTQLDLIPDHERAGAVDDAFVLRVAHGLAAEHTDKIGGEISQRIGRLTNEEDVLHEFLDDEHFGRLRQYVIDLQEKPVRGRSVEQILSDPRSRTDMKREIDQTLKRLRPLICDDEKTAEQIEIAVRSYLQMKLKV